MSKKQTKSFTVVDKRRSSIDPELDADGLPSEERLRELKQLAKKAQEENYIVPIKPKDTRVLVRNDETPDSYGAVIIPDGARRRCLTGVIIAIGPNVTTCKIGERVFFGQYDGSAMEFKRKKNLTLLDETVIKATIEGEMGVGDLSFIPPTSE